MTAFLQTLLSLLAALFWAFTLTPDHQNHVREPFDQPDYSPPQRHELPDHDGVGRLVRTQSPWPNAESATGSNRSERFFYDGVRRIQELVTDPLPTLEFMMAAPDGSGGSGGSGVPPEVLSAAAAAVASSEEELDGDAIPAGVEAAQLGSPTPVPTTETTLAREYVWGPGDNGLDELLVQFDEDRRPWWTLQDAGGDIVALVNVPFAHLPPGTSNRATLVSQWQYDAYGSVLSAESFAAPNNEPVPHLHAGHKGLFFDRLDSGGGGGVVDPVTLEDLPRLIPYAHAVYHVRNRAYQPAMGRWMQQDPNATAMSLIEAASHSGRGMGAIALALSAEDRYGDGHNLYEYLGSNPWTRRDPLGLWLDAALLYADVGFTVGSLARDLTSVYAANQESDAEWASDWGLPDDFHTRGNADWIAELYADHDINGVVNNSINPLPFSIAGVHVLAGKSSFYETGTKAFRLLRLGGNLVTTGAKHHWFFRTLTKFRKGTKEIMSTLPGPLHREFHTWADRRVRALVPGAPSIWHPGGETVWRKFMGQGGNPELYFAALRQATLEFFEGKVDNLKDLERILDEAGL